MAITFKNFNYREAVPGSPTENIGQEKSTAKMVGYNEWDDHELALDDVMEWAESSEVDGSAGEAFFIHRNIPMQHLRYEDWLYCDGVQFGDDSAGPEGLDDYKHPHYEEAKFELSFSTRPYIIKDDATVIATQDATRFQEIQIAGGFDQFPNEASFLRYISVRLEPRAQWISHNGMAGATALKFNKPEALVEFRRAMVNRAGIFITEADLYITHHRIPLSAYPAEYIKECVGKCNKHPLGDSGSDFWPLLKGIRAGDVVFCAPTIKVLKHPPLQSLLVSPFIADVTFKFLYKAIGANSFYNMLDSTLGPVSRDGDTQVIQTPGPTEGQMEDADGVLIPDQAAAKLRVLYPPIDFDPLFNGGNSQDPTP